MNGFQMQREQDQERVIYFLEGRLDAEAARELTSTLEPERREQILDFSGIREIHDQAFGTLAGLLKARGPRCRLRGLREHQLRVLRYLGLEQGEAGAGAQAE